MDDSVFPRLLSLADPARARLLLVLERHELTVSELCAVVQLPQSTVSRHLRILADEGWLSWRAEGTSRYYRRSSQLEDGAGRLWEAVRSSLGGRAEADQDEERAQEQLGRRRSRSSEFFSTAAARWDGMRAELFGGRPELPALLALLDPTWVVGDLGCGTGQLAETLAPYVRRVVAVDDSAEMLEAARARLADVGVELRRGRLESLPLDAGSLDAAVLSLVLHYVPRPERALEEAHRVLRRGGRLLVVDMVAHDREEYREAMGHLWPGFTAEQMSEWLGSAGFTEVRQHHLRPDPAAKGPVLFVAGATRG